MLETGRREERERVRDMEIGGRSGWNSCKIMEVLRSQWNSRYSFIHVFVYVYVRCKHWGGGIPVCVYVCLEGCRRGSSRNGAFECDSDNEMGYIVCGFAFLSIHLWPLRRPVCLCPWLSGS